MTERLRFYLVDDSETSLHLARTILEAEGHEVRQSTSSTEALQALLEAPPACALIDVMMPGMDGIELCHRLRSDPRMADTAIIMVSAKAYETDRNRAIAAGANGYILKPIERTALLKQIDTILRDEVILHFWGVRGTLPVPGRRTVRYGGNTSCLTIEIPQGPLFILDAGTGIKELSNHLLATGKKRIDGEILITHPHWDHINALPFFAPIYMQGNAFEILGPPQGEIGMQDLIAAQMDGIYFPVTVREFGASVAYRDLRAGEHEIGGLEISSMLLSHPGACLGYRFDYHGRSICYITDNELYEPGSDLRSEEYVDQLAAFVRGTDALVTDCTYTDKEYAAKVGWGHSSVSHVAELAARAGAKTLYIMHHDHAQGDDDIDRKLEAARKALAERDQRLRCEAPADGDEVLLPRPASGS